MLSCSVWTVNARTRVYMNPRSFAAKETFRLSFVCTCVYIWAHEYVNFSLIQLCATLDLLSRSGSVSTRNRYFRRVVEQRTRRNFICSYDSRSFFSLSRLQENLLHRCKKFERYEEKRASQKCEKGYELRTIWEAKKSKSWITLWGFLRCQIRSSWKLSNHVAKENRKKNRSAR